MNNCIKPLENLNEIFPFKQNFVLNLMVSFGSSKGSMVETLVFETPTPLSEHVEPNFRFGSEGDHKAPAYNTHTKINMDDSGIEVQEECPRLLQVNMNSLMV
ncbi:hypothetical protein GQX74_010158 [Glossina fuscipes]|nr:hypothetical protein GQX74_010158 [Glossina fuscipes]